MRKIAFILLGLIILFLCVYFYAYKDHRDVIATEASISLTSQELLSIFKDTDQQNNLTVLDQVIEVKGKISSINGRTVILDEIVFVEMVDSINVSEGAMSKIKGRCLGYDDLLEEIKIDQGIINN